MSMALSKEYFAQKLIKNQNKWVGTTRTMQNGKNATIIAYRRAHDIDIQFEDDLIVTHKQLNDFVRGQIRHPIYSQKIDKKVGMIVNTKKWGKIECIGFRRDGDFDVLFHDYNDVIRKHCSGWKHFQSGNISPQRRKREPFVVGRTSVSIYTNQKMTVIEIDPVTKWYKVQFEDGYITDWVKGGTQRFTVGHIGNPRLRQSFMEDKYIGKTIVAKNGLKATSLQFSNPNSSLMVDVQFEDGAIIQVRASDFLNGCIKHPFPYQIDSICMKKVAYIYNGEGNFYCKCRKCGLSDVMSLAEIKEHIC